MAWEFFSFFFLVEREFIFEVRMKNLLNLFLSLSLSLSVARSVSLPAVLD